MCASVGGELVGEYVVDGKEELDAAGFSLCKRGAGDVEFIELDEGFAGCLTLRVEKGVGHGAADEESVDAIEESIDDGDFIGDLGAADDGDEGAVGLGGGLGKVGELLVHEQAGGGLRDEVGDALGGGVGAVSGAECVIDVDVAEAGELFCEGCVVGFLLRVEAKVFQEQCLAGFEIGGELGGDLTDAVWSEGYVFVFVEDVIEQRAEAVHNGAQRECVHVLAFGTAEVGGENDAGLAAQSVLDGGDGFADARVIRDAGRRVFGEGDVEVDADEDALAGEIQIADGKLGHLC